MTCSIIKTEFIEGKVKNVRKKLSKSHCGRQKSFPVSHIDCIYSYL